MYYMIKDCPYLDPTHKYESLDFAMGDLRNYAPLCTSVDEAFAAYFDTRNDEVVLDGEKYKPSLVMLRLSSVEYNRKRGRWLKNQLMSMEIAFTAEVVDEWHIGNIVIKAFPGEVGPFRVFCKDNRPEIDSVFMHSIYDTTEEAEEMAQKLNDFAIHNMLPDRYFVAEKGFKPTEAQVMARLKQVTISPTR